MKKRNIIICCVLLAFVLIAGMVINSAIKTTNVKPFNLYHEPYYLRAMQDFPSDKYLGEVLTAKDAQEKALKEWLDLFGDKIYKEKPYQVFFDEQNGVWLVKGSLPRGYIGGVAYIIMRKSDGKILAIWHDQ